MKRKNFAGIVGKIKEAIKNLTKLRDTIQKFDKAGISTWGLSASKLKLFDSVPVDDLKKYKQELDEIAQYQGKAHYRTLPDGGADWVSAEQDKMWVQSERYSKALKDVDKAQKAVLLSSQGLHNVEIQQILASQNLTATEINQAMAEAGLLKSTQKLTAEQIKETLQTTLGSEADVDAAMDALKLTNAYSLQGKEVKKLTAENIKLAVSKKALSEEDAAKFANALGIRLDDAAKGAGKLANAWDTLVAGTKAGFKSLLQVITGAAKWLFTTPKVG